MRGSFVFTQKWNFGRVALKQQTPPLNARPSPVSSLTMVMKPTPQSPVSRLHPVELLGSSNLRPMRSWSALLADMTSCTSTALAAIVKNSIDRSASWPSVHHLRHCDLTAFQTYSDHWPTSTENTWTTWPNLSCVQTRQVCGYGHVVGCLCHLPRIDGWLDMLWPTRRQQSR